MTEAVRTTMIITKRVNFEISRDGKKGFLLGLLNPSTGSMANRAKNMKKQIHDRIAGQPETNWRDELDNVKVWTPNVAVISREAFEGALRESFPDAEEIFIDEISADETNLEEACLYGKVILRKVETGRWKLLNPIAEPSGNERSIKNFLNRQFRSRLNERLEGFDVAHFKIEKHNEHTKRYVEEVLAECLGELVPSNIGFEVIELNGTPINLEVVIRLRAIAPTAEAESTAESTTEAETETEP